MTTIAVDETKRGAKNLIAYLRTFSFVEIQTEPEDSVSENSTTVEEFLEEMGKEKINYDRLLAVY